MKLELDSNTADTIRFVSMWVVGGLVVAFIVLATYSYNRLAFDQGYTQKQLESTTQTYWVKE